jgi:hypothetical protein
MNNLENPSIDAGNKLSFVKFRNLAVLILLPIAILVGTFFHFYLKKIMIFDPANVLTIWIVNLFLMLSFKSDYTKTIFVINLIIGTFLVSFYPFGQGLTIVLLLLFSQKLFKLL